MAQESILIVDDDAVALEVLEDVLRLHLRDVIVDTTSSPVEALKRVATTDYGAILTDLKMPVLDGLELLSRVLVIRPQTRVLLMTGHGEEDTRRRALASGAFAFIQKPFDRDALISLLTSALTAPRRSD